MNSLTSEPGDTKEFTNYQLSAGLAFLLAVGPIAGAIYALATNKQNLSKSKLKEAEKDYNLKYHFYYLEYGIVAACGIIALLAIVLGAIYLTQKLVDSVYFWVTIGIMFVAVAGAGVAGALAYLDYEQAKKDEKSKGGIDALEKKYNIYYDRLAYDAFAVAGYTVIIWTALIIIYIMSRQVINRSNTPNTGAISTPSNEGVDFGDYGNPVTMSTASQVGYTNTRPVVSPPQSQFQPTPISPRMSGQLVFNS